MNKSLIGAVAGGAVTATAIFSLGSWMGSRNVAPLNNTESVAVVAPQQAAPPEVVPAAVIPEVVVRPAYADILSVTPITKVISTPREVCRDNTVVHQRPVNDEQRVTGKLLGAVIGGVIGHQFGGGKGKDAATVGGAVLGGIVGDNVQRNKQQTQTYTTTERQCETVQDRSEKILSYDVAYRYDGRSDVIRLGYQPESRVPVREQTIVFLPYGGANITPVTLPVIN
ncbi:MAG: glycine zipper 2TM domain-containing protein [Alcanivoracaceae bacterium]|nr:glycine zipper 2TM domain-containing protein [Alcanivoracaceae bacterium]